MVIPLWHPQYLHSKYQIRALDEPKGLLRGKDSAQLVIHKDALHKFDAAHIDILKRITLGNEAVTTMDSYHHVDGLTYKQAALRWIADNKARVDSWFRPTPAETLAQLNITLPPAPAAAGEYLPFTMSDSGIIETSYQLPWVNKTLAFQGIVVTAPNSSYTGPDALTQAQGIEACRICALNLLAQLSAAAHGDLSRVRLIRLEGFVAAGVEMVDSPTVGATPMGVLRCGLTRSVFCRFLTPHPSSSRRFWGPTASTRGRRFSSHATRSMSQSCSGPTPSSCGNPGGSPDTSSLFI